MNVLAMGINLWQDDAELDAWQSAHGHEVRTLGVEGVDGKHYTFAPFETATDVIARISREWTVDILLCGCPEFHPPPLHIEEAPVRTVAVISDWNLYQPQLEHNLARYDVVLSDKRGSMDLKLCEAKPLYWQPIYSHRPLVHRDLGLTRDIDIGYFGNLNPAAHPRRHRLLESIRSLAGQWRVEISGEHPPHEYARVLNRTRIAFNCSIRGEMNLRCFEAPACGAMLFIEADNLEAPDYYRDGESAVFYSDDDLMEKLEYYLCHEEERSQIARAGKQVAQRMCAANRLDDLIHFIATAPTSGRPFHAFDPGTKLRADAMQHSSALPPSQQAVTKAALDAWLSAYPHDPAALMAMGCFTFDAAAWASGEERKHHLLRAADCFSQAATSAPQDCAPWLNLCTITTAAGIADRQHPMWQHAATVPHTALAPFVLGKRTNPHYIDLRLRLALGQDPTPALHAMARYLKVSPSDSK